MPTCSAWRSYKAQRAGATITVADRWFASSKLHHGCGCTLTGKGKIDKVLTCAVTKELVDRDNNAAKNLRDWTEHTTSLAPVRDGAPMDPGPTVVVVGTDLGFDHGMIRGRMSDNKSFPRGKASCGEAKIKTPQGDAVRCDH